MFVEHQKKLERGSCDNKSIYQAMQNTQGKKNRSNLFYFQFTSLQFLFTELSISYESLSFWVKELALWKKTSLLNDRYLTVLDFFSIISCIWFIKIKPTNRRVYIFPRILASLWKLFVYLLIYRKANDRAASFSYVVIETNFALSPLYL